ncbi:MAG: YdcF family protein [Anaerolineae bacterium]|nr:YdcF family protein [Anaerolineae bacterium]
MNPFSNDITTAEKKGLIWPQKPSGILIMGKRQGTKKENKQLHGRIAMAAALWYSAPQPKPYLMFVASDIHSRKRIPDVDSVKKTLVEEFGIPDDFLILRQKSNCTLLEVRSVRAINRAYDFARIFVITHLYHAHRAQIYFNEVLPDAMVIPVHPDILTEIAFPPGGEALLNHLRTIIETSQPQHFDLLREHCVEWMLMQAHRLDNRGRLERRLTRVLRPETY